MTAIEEYNKLNQSNPQGMTWDAKQSAKIDILIKHISEIEQTLRYLVDRKVEEKYGK